MTLHVGGSVWNSYFHNTLNCGSNFRLISQLWDTSTLFGTCTQSDSTTLLTSRFQASEDIIIYWSRLFLFELCVVSKRKQKLYYFYQLHTWAVKFHTTPTIPFSEKLYVTATKKGHLNYARSHSHSDSCKTYAFNFRVLWEEALRVRMKVAKSSVEGDSRG